jgi:hypothetical protein
LWQDFDRHYGTASPDLLVWKAPSALMNPSIRPERLERERRLDPLRFAREYLAEFAQDIAAAFDPVVIDQAIIRGRREQPREEGRRYHAFVDPSGGGADAFSLAVGHNEEGRAVIDLVRWWQGGSPAGHVEEVAGLLKSYGVSRATGDRYAGSWVADAFAKAGISYDQAERVKSDLYLELIAYLNSARVELLDLPRLRQELQNLERRPGPGGKDRIDHPIGHHDDTANAVAGVVHLLLHRRESFVGRAKTVVITHNRRAARVAEEQEFLMAFADPEKVKEARERRQKRLEASLRPGRGVPSRGFLR